VLKAMFVTKLKTATAVLLMVALVGIGGGATALLAGHEDGRIRAQEPLGISGKWAGMGVNSDGNKGTASLMVEEHSDGTLTGKWGAAGSEMTIEKGERVTPQVLHWECSAGIYRYRVRCTMEGKALVITYTLTGKEDGKVNGHTGTGVLVRE
jgi:hypothetical protein